MATFCSFDLVVHRWDIARGTGLDSLDGGQAGACQTAWRAGGICRPPVGVADNADRPRPRPAPVEPPECATSPVSSSLPQLAAAICSGAATRLRQSRAHDEQ